MNKPQILTPEEMEKMSMPAPSLDPNKLGEVDLKKLEWRGLNGGRINRRK